MIVVNANDLICGASELVINERDVDHVYHEVSVQRDR